MMPNRAEFMVTWLAVSRLPRHPGGAEPGGPQLRRRARAAGLWRPDRRCQRLDYAALFTEPSARLPRPGGDHRVPPPPSPTGSAPTRGPGPPARPAEARGDLTNIFYTSGTTGPPKGCAVGHDYWVRFADADGEQFSFTSRRPDDLLPAVLLQRSAVDATARADKPERRWSSCAGSACRGTGGSFASTTSPCCSASPRPPACCSRPRPPTQDRQHKVRLVDPGRHPGATAPGTDRPLGRAVGGGATD